MILCSVVMSRRFSFIALIAAIGCTRNHAETPVPSSSAPPGPQLHVETTPLQPGDIQGTALGAFRPVSVVVADTGNCIRLPSQSDGLRRMMLLIPDSIAPRRTLFLVVDTLGKVAQYSERRGDIGGEGREPSTSVFVDFQAGTANAMNERPGSPMEVTMASAQDVAALPAFRVSAMIDLVRRRCADR